MRPLTDPEILSCWERGLHEMPVQRALRLLQAATPGSTPDTLAELSVGELNRRLLSLRELMYGPEIQSICRCPSCDDELEISFLLSDVLRESGDTGAGENTFVRDGYTIRFRSPTGSDLLAVSAIPDTGTARKELFRRCIVSARQRKTAVPAEAVPAPVEEALIERIGIINRLADIRIDLACPSCGRSREELFDIGSFLWHEIDASARSTLHDVHDLALAYGWDERDILGMSPARREAYLEMINP